MSEQPNSELGGLRRKRESNRLEVSIEGRLDRLLVNRSKIMLL